VARHNTYMKQITRHKNKSFDEMQARKRKEHVETEEYKAPSVRELLSIAGGNHHVVNDSSAEAFRIRTMLAERALKAKARIHNTAVEKGITKPRKTNWIKRHIAPIWKESYEGTSSEEEDDEEAKRLMKAARKKKAEMEANAASKWKAAQG